MWTMTTFRLRLPAQARARLTAIVLLPTPSLGPVNMITRPGSRGALPVSFGAGLSGISVYLTISMVMNRNREFSDSVTLELVKRSPMIGI